MARGYNIITVGLATFALSKLITQENGPWGVFSRLRSFASKKLPKQPTQPLGNEDIQEWQTYQAAMQAWLDNEQAYLKSTAGILYGITSCIICCGAYVSFLLTLYEMLITHSSQWKTLPLKWLAAYGFHIVLAKMTAK